MSKQTKIVTDENGEEYIVVETEFMTLYWPLHIKTDEELEEEYRLSQL